MSEISERVIDAMIPCKHCVSQGGANSSSVCSRCNGVGVVTFKLRISALREFQRRLVISLQASTRGSELEEIIDYAAFKLERRYLTGQLTTESWDTSQAPF